jgi:hypothetical protein
MSVRELLGESTLDGPLVLELGAEVVVKAVHLLGPKVGVLLAVGDVGAAS